MAIYHASATIVSRGKGKSVIAAAAYRVGDRLRDDRLGRTFDYTKKQGIESTAILAPDNAPDWVYNRERLWNEVEAVERRKDAQLAREFNIALPVELSRREMKALGLAYVREQFVERGMIADVAFHDLDSPNPHFHVLLTMRDITEAGFGNKNRDWNSKDLLVEQREAWANRVNAALERVGSDNTIDHRTLVAQGITERVAQVHLGPDLHRIRQQYIESGDLEGFRERYSLGDLYETINELNRQLALESTALESLDRAIATERATGRESVREVIPETRDEPTEEAEREQQREDTTEPSSIGERLDAITDRLRSSDREADEDRLGVQVSSEHYRRGLQSFAERLRGGSREVGDDRGNDRGDGRGNDRETGREAGEQRTESGLARDSRSPRSTGEISRETESGTGVNPERNLERTGQIQPELRGDVARDGFRPEESQRVVGRQDRDRAEDSPEMGRGDVGSDQSPDLDTRQPLSPQRRPNSDHQGQTQQSGDQGQPAQERAAPETDPALAERQRVIELQNQAALATLLRFIERITEEEEGGWKVHRGQKYTLRVNEGEGAVELHALDGRGLVFQRSDGRITAQLTGTDIENLERVKRGLDQRQTERCAEVLYRFWYELDPENRDNDVRRLEFDPDTNTLTYEPRHYPGNSLVSRWNGEAWEYVGGRLTAEIEEKIAVNLRQEVREWIAEREREREREEDRGFSR